MASLRLDSTMKFLTPIFLLLALLLAGCDESFDPFVGEDERVALHGFLDARQDTQFVRVQPIADETREPRLGEADLTSTALGSGTMRTWQDSLVTLDDGSAGLLFFAAFRPVPGEVYRIEAEGDDGAEERVEVAMPAEPPLTASQPVEVGGVISQRLTLLSELRPEEVRVIYTVRLPGGEPVDVTVQDEAQPVFEGSGFDVLVGLSRDVGTVRSALGLTPEDEQPVELLGLRLRYVLQDPMRAVVEDGLGAIGVAAAFEGSWVLDPGFVEELGYVDAQGEG